MKQQINEEDIRRLIHGDEMSFRLVYEVYGNRLYLFARKLGLGIEDSEEIVQESFLRLWLSRDSIRADQPIGGYIITSLRPDS